MNKKLGFYSSIIMTVSTIMFAFGMIINYNNLSYFVCMILSWAYLLVVCSFAVEVKDDRKAFAYGGMLFALLYGVFINLVYFAQLTTVAYKSASLDILEMLSYEYLGSLFFNIDLLGYGFMAASSCLIGLSIVPNNRNDKLLKKLLIYHILVFPGIFLPIFNVFNPNMGSNGDLIGMIVLLIWCIYFIPVGIISTLHFKYIS